MSFSNSKYGVEQCAERRRVMLAGMTALLGSSVASRLVSQEGFIVAMAFAESDSQSAQIFSSEQLLILKKICQTVIPKTDTAGAGDVDTHLFIDHQLQHCFNSDVQNSMVTLVVAIDRRANLEFGDSFAYLSQKKATKLLATIDLAAGKVEGSETANFKFLKSLIVFGYYTSEVGASKELRYDPVPGGFTSNVPLQEIGSAWGSNAFF